MFDMWMQSHSIKPAKKKNEFFLLWFVWTQSRQHRNTHCSFHVKNIWPKSRLTFVLFGQILIHRTLNVLSLFVPSESRLLIGQWCVPWFSLVDNLLSTLFKGKSLPEYFCAFSVHLLTLDLIFWYSIKWLHRKSDLRPAFKGKIASPPQFRAKTKKKSQGCCISKWNVKKGWVAKRKYPVMSHCLT